MADLTRMMRKFVRDSIYNDGVPAILGRLDETTLYFTDANGMVHRDSVWVRYTDQNSPTMETVVRNGGVPPQIGMPVKIISIRNVPTAVVNRYGLQSTQFTGGGGSVAVEAHSRTHKRLGSDPFYLQGLAFVPLLVRPSDPPALTVYVEPGWYRYLGTWDVWEGGDSGSLSGYVPASTTVMHFVIICLNRSTNTLVIVDGDDITISIYGDTTIGFSDIEAISINEDYYPLATVKLINGQTTVIPSDITHDLRLWGLEVRKGSDEIMTDGLGNVMVDGLGNVMVES